MRAEQGSVSGWRCWVTLSEDFLLCLILVLLCWEIPRDRTITDLCPSLAFQLGWGILQELIPKLVQARGALTVNLILDETEKGEVKKREKGKWKLLEGSREDPPWSHPALGFGEISGVSWSILESFKIPVCYTEIESKKPLHTQWNLCPVAAQRCFFINNNLCDSTPVPNLHKCVW